MHDRVIHRISTTLSTSTTTGRSSRASLRRTALCLALALAALPACTKITPKNTLKALGTVSGVVKLTAGGHMEVTVQAWSRFSVATGGVSVLAKSAADVPTSIVSIFDQGVPPGEPVDLVFVIDTTGSMSDDIDAVKHDMREILAHLSASNPDRQIGVVAYRDKGDDYVSQTFLQMTYDDAAIHAAIDALTVDGGGDRPEHVYAGLDTALREQPWRPTSSQHIILMGDAPPHEDYHDDPRNYDSVVALAQTPPLSVQIHTIGAQCDKRCSGR